MVAKRKPVKKGGRLPDVCLPSASGETVCLRDLIGKKRLVVFFYPKDESPICTKEACAFRDAYGRFEELNAHVVGISADTAESHKKFSQNHELPFILLSDSKGDAARKFGIGATLGVLPGRVTYVIDKRGRVKAMYSSQFRPGRHVEEALQALQESEE